MPVSFGWLCFVLLDLLLAFFFARRERLPAEAALGREGSAAAQSAHRYGLPQPGPSLQPPFSYTVRNHRDEIACLRRELKHRVPRAIPRNAIWALDLTGKGDLEGSLHPILGIEDHGSRKLLALQALERKNAWTLLGQLFLAIGRFGKPNKIRTDNEPMFKGAVFRSALWSLASVNSSPLPVALGLTAGSSGSSARSKASSIASEIDSREALNGLLADFDFWYNAIRPHQHLAGLTPDQAWRGIDPYRVAPKSVQWFQAWDGLLTGYYLRH